MTQSQRVDDVMLMAYVDGEVDTETAREIETAIARDPALGARARHFRDSGAFARAAFAESLHEPVPDRLLAVLGAAPAVTPTPANDATPGNVVPLRAAARAHHSAPWIAALAASVAVIAIGAWSYEQRLAGLRTQVAENEAFVADVRERLQRREAEFAQVSGRLDESQRLVQVISDRWAGNVAAIYREVNGTLQRDQRLLVDYTAEMLPAFTQRMTQSLNRPLTLPDLSNDGFQPQGGRVLTISGKSAANFYYVTPQNEMIGIVISPTDDADAPARAAQYDDVNMLYTRSGGVTYSVVSTIPTDRLQPIADRLFQQLR
jgi:anti-sigma factor RsiW